ncbi:MAG: WYL domain-containing protein [Corynebacterium sp.]|nr:WYL domain-containing protein [Corynebacterium sp.]
MSAGSKYRPANNSASKEYLKIFRHFNLYGALHDSANRRTNPARTLNWIRTYVDGYQDKSDEAFEKAIKRDVDFLRRSGVPIRERINDDGFKELYLDKDAVYLPEVAFTPEEAVVLAIATGLEHSGGLYEFSQTAWTKLAAAGASRIGTNSPIHSAVSDLSVVDPVVIRHLVATIRNKLRITFAYSVNPSQSPQRRVMDPWGLVPLNNRVYLVGYDIDRDAPRAFRVLNVSDIKRARSAYSHQRGTQSLQEIVEGTLLRSSVTAQVKIAKNKALELAAHGKPLGDDTYELADVPTDWLIRTAAAYGDTAEILEPAWVRESVIALVDLILDPSFPQLSGTLAPWKPAHDTAGGASTSEKGTSFPRMKRFTQLANIVPYFRSHPDTTLMEAAADLGISYGELTAVLRTLFDAGVSNLPGDSFELSWNPHGVTIAMDQGINKAMKLTPTEACTLLLTLESFEGLPGIIDGEAVRSAAAKIRGIMDAETAAIFDSLANTAPEETAVQAGLAQALNDARQVAFTYWSSTSNESKRRIVHPAHLHLVDTELYLQAWDDAAKGPRTFRVDRISELEILSASAAKASLVPALDPTDPFGLQAAERATILIHSDSLWLSRYYNIEIGDFSDGPWVRASVPIGSQSWFTRFALSNADRIAVVAPTNLAEAIVASANELKCRYTQQEIT